MRAAWNVAKMIYTTPRQTAVVVVVVAA
jgi:hypothetical protein